MKFYLLLLFWPLLFIVVWGYILNKDMKSIKEEERRKSDIKKWYGER